MLRKAKGHQGTLRKANKCEFDQSWKNGGVCTNHAMKKIRFKNHHSGLTNFGRILWNICPVLCNSCVHLPDFAVVVSAFHAVILKQKNKCLLIYWQSFGVWKMLYLQFVLEDYSLCYCSQWFSHDHSETKEWVPIETKSSQKMLTTQL